MHVCMHRMQEHVKREKQIMAECDCPFMVNLVSSFKDGQHLYMLMECVMGGELFTYLQVRPTALRFVGGGSRVCTTCHVWSCKLCHSLVIMHA